MRFGSYRGHGIAGLLVGVLLLLAGSPAFAGFASTESYLPSVGLGKGAGTSYWYTVVWVHNPGTSSVDVRYEFLERDKVNTSPVSFSETIPAGDTRRYTDALATIFGITSRKFGAIRVVASAPVVVNGRIFSKDQTGPERDSVGQFFGAVPGSFAIAAGESTRILGVYQTNPQANSEYRFNFGFVEVGGGTATVRVSAEDDMGNLVGSKDYTVLAYEPNQYNITDLLPAINASNLTLKLEVLAGSTGKVVAFGSGLANRSNDPSTFEMQYDDSLLGGGGGTVSGVTAGQGLTGGGSSGAVTVNVGAGDGISVSADAVSVADGGITGAKLADSAVTAGKIATGNSPSEGKSLIYTNGALQWQEVAGGGGGGDITGVSAGNGLIGGAESGEATISVAPAGITAALLADSAVTVDKLGTDAVTRSKLADGSVSTAELQDDAVTANKIGAGAVTGSKIADGVVTTAKLADDSVSAAKLASGSVTTVKLADGAVATAKLADGAVTAGKVGTSGGSSGQVLTVTASGVAWQNPGGFALPYTGSTAESGAAFQVSSSAGAALQGTSSQTNGTAVIGQADWGTIAWGVYGRSQQGIGVVGSSDTGTAVRGSSGNGTGVAGYGAEASTGIYGRAGNGSGAFKFTGVGAWGDAAGSGMGVYGTSSTGSGVVGFSFSGSGVEGSSSSGVGVRGSALATAGRVHGVQGVASSPQGVGVYGEASDASSDASDAYGGYFRARGFADYGVYGISEYTGGAGEGGHFESWAAHGTGAAGVATGGGETIGVYGRVSSAEGKAVAGNNEATGVTGYLGRGAYGVYSNGDAYIDGNLVVTGNIGASSSGVRYLSLPPAAFQPVNGGISYDTSNYLVNKDGGVCNSQKSFVAPVLLPHGATIRSVRQFVANTGGSPWSYESNVTCNRVTSNLRRLDLYQGSQDVMTIVGMSGSLAGYAPGNYVATEISSPVVDNMSFAYSAEVSLPGTGAELDLLGLVIEFEITQP